jgi:hypothetical protein
MLIQIFVTWNEESRKTLGNIIFRARIDSNWGSAYHAEILLRYDIYMECTITDIVGENFAKLANNVLVNSKNTPILKFRR